jgi:hypothetical protein
MKSLTTKRVLIRALELIEDGWCQGEWACNGRGLGVMPTSPAAVAWSPVGALMKAGYEDRQAISASIYQLSLLGGFYIDEWNAKTGRTKADVIQLFRMAISRV